MKPIVEKPTTPWKPASRLDVPDFIRSKYLAGYRARFVRIADLDKKEAEGWEVVRVTDEERERLKRHHIRDGSPLGNVVQKNSLILCRMPEALARSRDEYFERRTSGSEKSVTNEFRKSVPTAYGKGPSKEAI